MASLNDGALDAKLNYIKNNGTKLHLCTTEPTTYAEAETTYSIAEGNVTITGPTNGDVSGRKITVPALSGVTSSGAGNTNFRALTNGTDTLVWVGAVASPVNIGSGTSVSTTAFDIEDPDYSEA